MKKQAKRLKLNKETITALNEGMVNIKGGGTFSCNCPPVTLVCPVASNTCTINVVTCVVDPWGCGYGDTAPFPGGNCM
ncbi:MAG: hypothetical protein GY757_20290 [bacterium]|nr:hypothetical protein [bacterium]